MPWRIRPSGVTHMARCQREMGKTILTAASKTCEIGRLGFVGLETAISLNMLTCRFQFGKVFAVSMASRSDRRDAMALGESHSIESTEAWTYSFGQHRKPLAST